MSDDWRNKPRWDESAWGDSNDDDSQSEDGLPALPPIPLDHWEEPHFDGDLDPNAVQIPDEVAQYYFPRALAEELHAVPIYAESDTVTVAMAELDIHAVDKLRFMLNRDIRLVRAPLDWIRTTIKRLYGDA